MATCVNKNSREYQYLKQASNLSDYKLSWQCNVFLDQYGRMPYLDELYGADSSIYIKNQLHITDDNCSVSDLIKFTGADGYSTAIQTINNKYRDIQIDGTQIKDAAIVNITRKPEMNKTREATHYDLDNKHDFLIFNDIVNKLKNLYNIPIKTITNYEILRTMPLVIGSLETAAFIYNDTIYVNTDIASADAPIHELLHIFIGSMRRINPNIYYSLVANAENFKHYNTILALYPNRTRSTVDEEVFIHELARYIAGMDSDIKEMDYELLYNTQFILNNIMMGTYNAMALNNPYNSSIRQISKELDSPLCDFGDTYLLEEARRSRILANKKLELFERNELQEICL